MPVRNNHCRKLSGGRGSEGAFTLIELLVVLGVIAVLAGLILPALGSAKAKAHFTKCQSNVRQIALGIRMYAEDQEVYPLYSTPPPTPGPTLFWNALIEPYTLNNESNAVYRCPGYKGREYDIPPYSDLRYSYGYNSQGVGFDYGRFGLGLGGRLLSSPHVPVPESAVVCPTDMIAVADGYASGYSGGTVGLWGDQGWIGSHLKGMTGFPDMAWEKAAQARHRGKFAVAFCDGHVEGNSMKYLLYDMSEGALRRWNNDNRAHLELY